MLDGTIKLKLAVQEAKQMGLDVSDQINREIGFSELPPENTDNSMEKSIRNFAESQAKKLGMTPEQFHEKYVQMTAEQSSYMVAYLEEKLGEPDEDETEQYLQQANDLLDKLVKDHENEIDIFINE